MVVIADTSPLNYLVLIDAVEVLLQLYRHVVIPQSVLDELRHPDTPQPVKEWAALLPAWVEVVPPGQTAVDSDLAELDAGEAAAIALAQVSPEAMLLMDDVRGRKEAERRPIQTIGTLGILRDGAALGVVDLRIAFARLKQTSFRAPPGLMARLLGEAVE